MNIMMITDFTLLRAVVKQILLNPLGFQWTLQGFGMLRCYISKEIRLHVWHSGFSVPNFSPIHDHPWSFRSVILAGAINNQRYLPFYAPTLSPTEEYLTTTIKCGAGGGMVKDEVGTIHLKRLPMERYGVGSWYTQDARELHESFPEDGSVSMIYREFQPDTEHARICWKTGPWVSAEPRKAYTSEVLTMTQAALGRM
jgi:hypothetical protein